MLSSLSKHVWAKDQLKVKIFSSQKIKTILATPSGGEYEIYGNDTLITTFRKNDLIYFMIDEDKVKVQNFGKEIGRYRYVEIRGKLTNNELKIKPVLPSINSRIYEDDFILTAANGYLQMVNIIGIAKYLAGTVETEGGPKSSLEYYKVQAMLCRTYAYGHLDRHKEEGFELCDEVHCQAYHGKSKGNPQISYAVSETQKLVIVDNSNSLITAAYHSNCGGETVRSEHVWTMPLPYLIPIEEEYCLQSPHASWERSITMDEWINYLRQEGIENTDTLKEEFLKYDQKTRQLYYLMHDDSIPLKKIRSDWKLKSTYFDIIPIEGELFFEGKGYGHGVGMCQEGAMEMARKGKNYKEILLHYYKNVQIVKYQD